MSNTCSGCGTCCRLFKINISSAEHNSGIYQSQHVGKKLYLLDQQSDGSCIYLKNNLCQIHQTRPLVCRHFFCSSKNKKFSKMIELIQSKKEL